MCASESGSRARHGCNAAAMSLRQAACKNVKQFSSKYDRSQPQGLIWWVTSTKASSTLFLSRRLDVLKLAWSTARQLLEALRTEDVLRDPTTTKQGENKC